MQRDPALLGAANLSSRLYSEDINNILYPKSSSIASDFHVRRGSLASGDGSGTRRLLDPRHVTDDDYIANQKGLYGYSGVSPEYFTRVFVEMFLKGDEVDEFMKLVDLAGKSHI